MRGSLGLGRSPSATCRSVRQTPQARTVTSTWPGPGSGRGTSAARSGRPGASSSMARMAESYRGRESGRQPAKRLCFVVAERAVAHFLVSGFFTRPAPVSLVRGEDGDPELRRRGANEALNGGAAVGGGARATTRGLMVSPGPLPANLLLQVSGYPPIRRLQLEDQVLSAGALRAERDPSRHSSQHFALKHLAPTGCGAAYLQPDPRAMQPTAHFDAKTANTCPCLRCDFRLLAVGPNLDPLRADSAGGGTVLAYLEGDALLSALGDAEGIEPGRLVGSHHDAPPIRLLVPVRANHGVILVDRGPGSGGVSGGDIADEQSAVAQGVHDKVGIQSDWCGAAMDHSWLDPNPKIRILIASAAQLSSRVPRAVRRDSPG